MNPFIAENREGLIIASFLLVVAIIGKVITGWAVFGVPNINRLGIGIGMVPRGEVRVFSLRIIAIEKKIRTSLMDN